MRVRIGVRVRVRVRARVRVRVRVRVQERSAASDFASASVSDRAGSDDDGRRSPSAAGVAGVACDKAAICRARARAAASAEEKEPSPLPVPSANALPSARAWYLGGGREETSGFGQGRQVALQPPIATPTTQAFLPSAWSSPVPTHGGWGGLRALYW